MPEKRHFRKSGLDRAPNLGKNRRRSSVLLGAADVRNDAERAPMIAASLDRDPCAHTRPTNRRYPVVILLVVQFEQQLASCERSTPDSVDDIAQAPIGIRTGYQVYSGRALQEIRTEPLRHAARDGQHDIRPVAPHPLQLADPTEDPLLCVLADRAGVDDDHVRLCRVVHRYVAAVGQRSRHDLGVADVHLTPVGLDIRAAGDRNRRTGLRLGPHPRRTSTQRNQGGAHTLPCVILRVCSSTESQRSGQETTRRQRPRSIISRPGTAYRQIQPAFAHPLRS